MLTACADRQSIDSVSSSQAAKTCIAEGEGVGAIR